jgi:hypothetical protein
MLLPGTTRRLTLIGWHWYIVELIFAACCPLEKHLLKHIYHLLGTRILEHNNPMTKIILRSFNSLLSLLEIAELGDTFASVVPTDERPQNWVGLYLAESIEISFSSVRRGVQFWPGDLLN